MLSYRRVVGPVLVLLPFLSATIAAATPGTTVPTAGPSSTVTKAAPSRQYKSYKQQLGQAASAAVGSGTVQPNGPYSDWSWPGSGYYYNADEKLTVNSHTPGANYFWAHQFAFSGGDGGYIGLQDGSYPNNTKIALYSIWAANGASGPNRGTFSGEGSGYTCRLDPYGWVEGREYRLRVWVTSEDPYGRWYGAWVQDTATGIDSYIGSIRVPLAWGGIQGWTSWTEYFGPAVMACSQIPYSQITWKYPTANNGTVTILGHQHVIGSGDCPSYTGIYDVRGGDLQVLGSPQ